MAKVKLHPLFAQLSGRIGNSVFRTTKQGEVIVCQRPRKSSAVPSDAQKAQRQRFKEAVAYAKAAMAEPDVHAQYAEQAASLHKLPYNLALADYFKGRNLLER